MVRPFICLPNIISAGTNYHNNCAYVVISLSAYLAMVITAVHLDESGKPVRFRVENSWSEVQGQDGYFMMTDSWFDEYVFQVVVPRQLAAPELVKVLDSEPIAFKPWDPLGALA